MDNLPGDNTEHPAYRAAKLIREYCLETIAKIDEGFVFEKNGVNINDTMRAECEAHVARCDECMERAQNMDPKLWAPAALILEDLMETKQIAETVDRMKAN